MAHFWQRRICWLHDLRRDDEPGATSLPASTTNATFLTLAATAAPTAAITSLALAATTSLALAATAEHTLAAIGALAAIATLAAAAAALATQFAMPARTSTKLAHTDGWQHMRDHQ